MPVCNKIKTNLMILYYGKKGHYLLRDNYSLKRHKNIYINVSSCYWRHDIAKTNCLIGVQQQSPTHSCY